MAMDAPFVLNLIAPAADCICKGGEEVFIKFSFAQI